VSIGELIIGVNIALGQAAVENCLAFDINENGVVGINELIVAVGNALNGCAPANAASLVNTAAACAVAALSPLRPTT
jgi:hypothetical protein